MDLRELRLEQLPGLPIPFTISGEPGLNLILGPNGSGKSSLTRAALSLLFQGRPYDARCSATWHDRGVVWHAARTGPASVAWQRESRPDAPPPLPQAGQAACFHLGLLDILKLTADAGDQDLARAIRSQMAGGYDLDALLADAEHTGREGQKAAADLYKAQQQVDGKRQERRKLQEDEARLPDLRRQLQAARTAAVRAEALRAVSRAQAAQTEADAAAVKLAADHSAVMDRVQDGDGETLDRLRTRQRTTAADRTDTARTIADAEAALEAAGLPDGGPSPTALATAAARITEARQLAAELTRVEAETAAAEQALATARQSLAPWGAPSGDCAPDRDRLRAEARSVQSLLEAVAARESLARLLASPALQAGHEQPPAEVLAAGHRALLSWLAAAGERRLPWLPWLTGMALLILGAALQPWSDGNWPGWLALVLGIVAIVAGTWPRLAAERSRRAREAFTETGLNDPAVWSEQEVRRLAAALMDQTVQSLLERLRERLREDLTASYEQAARAAGQERFAPRLDAAEWLYRSAAFCTALSARDASVAKQMQHATALQSKLAAACEPVARWLTAPGHDLAAVSAAVETLELRRQAHDKARDRKQQAERRHTELGGRLEETAAELDALFQRFGLEPVSDNDAKVRAYARRLDRYRQERSEAQRLAALARHAHEMLAKLPPPGHELAQEALTWPGATLSAELAAAETTAALQQDLNDAIVAIQTRLDDALRDVALDEALLARDRAHEALDAVRDEARAKALRRLLLERLRQQHRRRSEPPVLQRARALVHRFTNGRYDLLVAEQDGESFRARDTATGEGLALSQLSDGTRAQLLLAARLAYIQETERGTVVPLFFDESLTASDSERFAAIGGAVLDLVADEGRQVFYLTCDPADVAAWQRLLAARGQPPAPVVDLARARGAAAAAPVERLRPAAAKPLPEPTPHEDPAAYAARLGDVPPLDLFAPATAAHVFHLLRDDLPLLHALLRRRVEQVGQIELLAPALSAAGVLGPAQHEGLRARARALAVFLETAAIGRGRPVPKGALSAESGSGSSLLPQIEDLLASPAVAGDAVRLVAALARGEIPRLQQKVQDEIAAWLQQAGHLDPRPALAPGEVRARVLAAATDDLAAGWLDMDSLDVLIAAWQRAAVTPPVAP